MPTVAPMRSLLRHAAVIAASVTLVFFWSCERHEPGELPDHSKHSKHGDKHGDALDKHGKHDGHDHGTAGHADDNPNPADGGAHQHGTGTPPPGERVEDPHLSSQAIPPVGTPALSPAGTPAQFFPSPTPR